MRDQAEQVSLAVPDEGLPFGSPGRPEDALGVGEDDVRLGDDVHSSITQLADPFLQVSDPEVDHRGPGRLFEQQPGAAEVDKHQRAEPGDQRQPEGLRVELGGPVQIVGVLGDLDNTGGLCSGHGCEPGSRSWSAVARASAHAERRASTATPAIPTAKPSGASMAVRLSQSGRSWDPDANITMITTMASTPIANRAIPIRTGTDARGANAQGAGPLPRGRDGPSVELDGIGVEGIGVAGIGSAGIDTGSDSSGTFPG